jgi:predicted dehydrogenase
MNMLEKKEIRTGFVGFGRMGITHFSILNTNPHVKPVAVCDQSSAMLNILGKYVDVETFSDYRKMIAESDLDCVVISTPSDSHTEIINHAIENNLHIFTEKPFAMNAADGRDTLLRLAGKKIVNQVGYVNRFNEVFMEVKKLLETGIIGDIKQFTSEMYGATVLKDSKSGWRGKKKTGGGCLYEFASHGIDLALYLFGAPSRVAGSILQPIYSSQVEDFVSSTFIYENGYTGSIVVNWSDETFRKPANIITINGTRGKIIADKHAYKIYLKDSDPSGRLEKGWNTVYITEFAESVSFYLRGNEFTRQLNYFIDRIRSNADSNLCSFADALETDVLMDMITQDAQRTMAEDIQDIPGAESEQRQFQKPSLWQKLLQVFKSQ